jgi:peptide/nickel transport system substrate-binding protein
MITFKKTLFQAIVILLLAMLVGCAGARSDSGSDLTEIPSEAGILTYGLTLSPSGIDPHVNASSELGIPLTNVYDTLVYEDPKTGRFEPGLAERWTVSDDAEIYTFYLRDDVMFHDGTPFNAEAVRVNLERIVDPATASQKAIFMLGPFDRSEVLEEFVIQIHLTEPYTPLLDALSQVYLGIASPTALERWGADYQFHQVGTGPFEFVEYIPNDHLTLVRNPDYRWGPSLFRHQGPAYLDEIRFQFVVDPATRAIALETGGVDLVGEIPPRDAQRLDRQENFQLYAVPIPGQPAQFLLNTQLVPLNDARVRQALLYATDREAIVRTVFGDTSPVAYGPLSEATGGYSAIVRDFYPFDPEKAAALLTAAGWEDGDGNGTRDREGVPLHLTMALGSWGFNPDMAQLLQTQWTEIGVELTAEVMPYPALLEAGQIGTHHLIGFNLFGRDPHLLASFYGSGGGFNFSHVTDPELDRWLKEGAIFSGPGRDKLYERIQQRIMEQALVLPVRDYVNLNVARAEVEGLRYDAQGWFPWLVDVMLAER